MLNLGLGGDVIVLFATWYLRNRQTPSKPQGSKRSFAAKMNPLPAEEGWRDDIGGQEGVGLLQGFLSRVTVSVL